MVQVLAADAEVLEWTLAVLDAVGDAADPGERGREGEPAQQSGPLSRVKFLAEHAADIFRTCGFVGHDGTLPNRRARLTAPYRPVARSHGDEGLIDSGRRRLRPDPVTGQSAVIITAAARQQAEIMTEGKQAGPFGFCLVGMEVSEQF